jgi:hypothetical protein
VFGVDWINVGYFAEHTDKLDSFQLILIDRSDTGVGNFDIEFNYQSIQWETGDASGGVNGLGGQSAHVGYSNGTGAARTFFELPGSGVPGDFLNNGALALITHDLLASTPGRYHFQVRNGAVQGFTDVTSSVRTFSPFRYVYDPVTQYYNGNLTVYNTGATAFDPLDEVVAGTIGPNITLVFTQLPAGVQLANQTGLTASGHPYITLPGVSLAQNQSLRVPIQLINPQGVALGTFSEGLPVAVIEGTFNPTIS